MMPYKTINVGDMFSNPMHRGFGKLSGMEWVVVAKDDDEKMIQIQGVRYSTGEPYGSPMWKSYRDRMFCESWRIFRSRVPVAG